MSLVAAARLGTDPHFDVHPPLFLIMLEAWSRGGLSEGWLRLLSVLPSLVSLGVLWRLSGFWGLQPGQRRALLWMQALSFAGLQLAREVRMYSWLEFWALLHLLALQQRRGWLAGLSLLAACYTHVFGLFLLPLAYTGPRLRLWRTQLLAMLLWLPWAWTHYRHQFSHPLDLRQLPSASVLLEAVGRIASGRLAAYGDPASLWAGAALMLALLSVLGLRRPVHIQVLALAILPPLSAWLVSRTTPLQIFEFKYFYWTHAAWATLALFSLPRLPAMVALVWAWLNLAALVPLLLMPHNWLANWRQTAEMTRSRSPVVVHPSMMSAPLLYYGVVLKPVDEWSQLQPGQDMIWVTTPHHPYVVRQGLWRGIERYWRRVSRETLRSQLPSSEIEVVDYRWDPSGGSSRGQGEAGRPKIRR